MGTDGALYLTRKLPNLSNLTIVNISKIFLLCVEFCSVGDFGIKELTSRLNPKKLRELYLGCKFIESKISWYGYCSNRYRR